MQPADTTVTEARRSGNLVVTLGVAAIVVILTLAAIFLFVSLTVCMHLTV